VSGFMPVILNNRRYKVMKISPWVTGPRTKAVTRNHRLQGLGDKEMCNIYETKVQLAGGVSELSSDMNELDETIYINEGS